MSMMTSVYPDEADFVSNAFIQQNCSHTEWEAGYADALRRAIRLAPTRKFCIDVGAGTGRLLPILGPKFDQILAIEPDRSRREQLTTCVEQLAMQDQVRIESDMIEDIGSESADCVLLSHVLQHITPTSADTIFNTVRSRYVRRRGIVVIGTCLSESPAYYIAALTGKRAVASPVSRHEFIKACEQSNNGQLPVRHFQKDELFQLLHDSGFLCIRREECKRFDFFLSIGNNRTIVSHGTDIILTAVTR